MAFTAGTRLGPYEITAQIGAGGMGEVYRATDANLGRQVAIKVLPDTFAHDPERLARFEREARTLASLNHPNIAQIYGLERADGIRALVMELVEGPTLAERIAQGPIPVDEALPVAKQIAEALEAAHEQGIIHRDLKPANVKIRDDGTVKVLDFGLAKAIEPVGARSPGTSQSPTITTPAVTQMGVILGTAAYMAPEQAKGKPADKRSDIWAFGCVLYEMLTSKRAFGGDEVSDVLASVLAREPDWTLLPRSLPPVLVTFLKRCLHKDRKQRIGDAQSLRLALEGAFETAAPHAGHRAVAGWPLWRRALPAATALAIVGGLLIGLATWGLWPSAEPQPVNRFVDDLPAGQRFAARARAAIALSPDGRRLVYNTAGGLYLRSMESLESRLIPGTEGAIAHPFFSADAESVGYFEGGQLKRIAIGGGAPVVICEVANSFGASWEADNTIFFGEATGIMRVSASGGTPELVIPAKEGEQVYGPQLLPDAESVLFSVATGTDSTRWDDAEIVVHSLRTGERRTVLRGGSDARYVRSGHLVYAAGDALFAVPFDIDRLEVRGGPVAVVQGVARNPALGITSLPAINTGIAHYGVSHGGTLVYVIPGSDFSATGARIGEVPAGTLVWVTRQGREEPVGAPLRNYVYARLSPDGMRVALDLRDRERDVWIWDIQRKTMTRLTFDRAIDGNPVWTSDGQRVVWTSQRAGDAFNLYWQAADGTGSTERLIESANSYRPSGFTPDGTRLIFSVAREIGPEPPTDLGMLSLDDGRRQTLLLQTPFFERNGEISPDGRWLAYESNESGRFEVYVRPFPAVNDGKWQVSTSGGRQPAWARKGRELFYVDPNGAIMGTRITGGASFTADAPVQLVPGKGYYYAWSTPQQGRTYDVSVTGDRFLRIKMYEPNLENGGLPSKVVVVQNWFEELKRLVPPN